ncbi:hypothetical protein POVWA1_024630 [Plasmodium ovale wallikeri]|uniref:Uncharacterized protein n=1 Tax=Plasmodium ovale wallikeri TaxID=864142 RepID=A0A1A8YTQ1_PLAOA|nr:hypothetical protein POVWA1_024630 [Plasmodium ovale wallikeri]
MGSKRKRARRKTVNSTNSFCFWFPGPLGPQLPVKKIHQRGSLERARTEPQGKHDDCRKCIHGKILWAKYLDPRGYLLNAVIVEKGDKGYAPWPVRAYVCREKREKALTYASTRVRGEHFLNVSMVVTLSVERKRGKMNKGVKHNTICAMVHSLGRWVCRFAGLQVCLQPLFPFLSHSCSLTRGTTRSVAPTWVYIRGILKLVFINNVFAPNLAFRNGTYKWQQSGGSVAAVWQQSGRKVAAEWIG